MTTKQRLRNKADKLWKQKILKLHPICEGCGKEPSITGHHFFPRSLYGHLRYVIENGIGIGVKCHFAHHHKGDPKVHQKIVSDRGLRWYIDLAKKSRENPASYQTISYYKSKIEELK